MKLYLAGDPLPPLRDHGTGRDADLERVVSGILEDVRHRGDLALLENARRFDSPAVGQVRVSDAERESGRDSLPLPQQDTLRKVYDAVRAFHDAQLSRLSAGLSDGRWQLEGARGTLGQRLIPVRRAGIYVPGGRANYPSSVLMNAVPAFCAGVKEIFVASPAGEHGTLSPAVLAAAEQPPFRVEALFKTGGAAAIAAFAFGTESVPKVDVVAGPGNKYVNEAKRQVWGQVGLDGFAGPSEVCLIVDDSTNPKFAAVDLLTQIEHAPDNVGFLVGSSDAAVRSVLEAAEGLIRSAARRSTLEASWQNGMAIVATDRWHAADLVNEIAPEHLGVATADPESWLPLIENAGCILLGEWTPESAGDFAAGPSHTLPTAGAARFQSPVNVLTFMKLQSLIGWTPEILADNREVIEAMGELEGFPMHGYGATVRFED